MRHLFVVDSLDKHIQNEKELIRPRRLLPAARATRARSAQFYVVLIRHDSTGVGGLFCICVESINLNLNLKSSIGRKPRVRFFECVFLYIPVTSNLSRT